MGLKILIVDDDRLNVNLIKQRLEKEGHETVVAYDGQTGLDQAAEVMPDLIILDVEMPLMNGYTFLFNFKQLKLEKKIPVIVLTSHEENKPIFEHRGASAYLIKPVDFDVLFAKIAELFPE